MSVKYALYETPNPSRDAKKQPLHARVVPGTTIRIDRVITEVSAFSSFSSADIRGILQAFIDQIVSHLKNGDELDLEGLGHFSITLSCPRETNPRKIQTEYIRFKTVRFRCSKKIKDRLRVLNFERTRRNLKGSHYSVAQRKKNIISYLEQYQTIQTSYCMALNGCTRYMAKKDLKEMQKEGTILNLGHRRFSIYGLRE